MRQEAVKAIDRLKPYGGGNDFLWRLHGLNNIDRHRLLFTVGKDILFEDDWMGNPFGFNAFLVKASQPHFSGVSDREVEKQILLEIGKTGSKPKVPHGNALLPSLHQ